MPVLWDSENEEQPKTAADSVMWDTADVGAPTPNPRGGDNEAMSIPTVKEAYSSMIKPVTEGVATAMRNLPMSTLTRAGMTMGPVKDALSWISNGAITGPPSQEQMERGSQTAAETIIPQNPVEAGAMLGTGFAGPAARLVGGPAGRVLTQALGAGAGSLLEGDSTGTALKNTGIHAAIATGGEATSALGSAVLRSLPNNPIIGGKQNIADKDAATWANAMARNAPDALNDYPAKVMGGAPNSSDLLDMARRGPQLIGDMKERAVQTIERMSTGGRGTLLHNQTNFKNTPLNLPSIGETLTLREANDRLSEIGARAFGQDPLVRNFNGKNQRELYGELAGDIAGELRVLNPNAALLFENIQQQVARGMTLLKPLQGSALSPGSSFRTGSTAPQLNTPKLQDLLNSPRGRALMERKLGVEEATRLADEMRRGAPAGLRDELMEGSGGMFDPLRRWARGQTNMGRAASQQVLGLAGIPNIGSSYVGNKPYSMPGMPQSIMDLLMGQYGQ